MSPTVGVAEPADATELAVVAAATFPLACPASVQPEDIAAFIAAHLSAPRFTGYLRDPDRRVLTARADGHIVGYAMLVGPGPAVELSKLYVMAEHHGAGAAAALMTAALDWALSTGAERVWLGVNRNNERAQRFYRKQGFVVTGERTFELGATVEHDFVMTRRL